MADGQVSQSTRLGVWWHALVMEHTQNTYRGQFERMDGLHGKFGGTPETSSKRLYNSSVVLVVWLIILHRIVGSDSSGYRGV